MGITPVTTKSDIMFGPLKDNNVINLLEKQKMQLQEQIQKISESKLDDKTKQDRIKQLQDQIQQVDMEIQQKRIEKLNQNQNANQGTMNSQSNNDSSGVSGDPEGLSHLIQAGAIYTQAKIMNSTKNGLNGKNNILKIEINLDESRGGDPKSKKAELQKAELKVQMLDKKAGHTLLTSRKQVNEASEAASENNDVKNEGKDEEIEEANFQDAISVNYDREEKRQLQETGKINEKNHKKIDIRL